MGKRDGLWLAALLGFVGCDDGLDVASRSCLRVLERRLPEAEVVELRADPRAAHATVVFEVGDWREGRARGELACRMEPHGSEGGWRVREATLDGVVLTAAELAVVNADLFLTDLGRAGSGGR